MSRIEIAIELQLLPRALGQGDGVAGVGASPKQDAWLEPVAQ